MLSSINDYYEDVLDISKSAVWPCCEKAHPQTGHFEIRRKTFIDGRDRTERKSAKIIDSKL